MLTRRTPKGTSGVGCIAAAVLLMAGCGTTSEPVSAGWGSGSQTTATTVRDVAIVPSYLDGRCAIQLSTGAELRLTIVNSRPGTTERLLGVSTNATTRGHVMTAIDVPPDSAVAVGVPGAQMVKTLRVPAIELATLNPHLRPAMSTEVTFHFQQAGDITVPAPVEACPPQLQ